jgi:hypothetical protein
MNEEQEKYEKEKESLEKLFREFDSDNCPAKDSATLAGVIVGTLWENGINPITAVKITMQILNACRNRGKDEFPDSIPIVLFSERNPSGLFMYTEFESDAEV